MMEGGKGGGAGGGEEEARARGQREGVGRGNTQGGKRRTDGKEERERTIDAK